MKARNKGARRGTRNRIAARHRLQAGIPPGVLRVDPEASPSELRAVCFGEGPVVERTLGTPGEIPDLVREHRVTWIEVCGLGTEAVLEGLRDVLQLHPLALEDVLNEHQRPKVEEYPRHYYAVLQGLDPEGGLPTEQINVLWGDRWVVTFQKRPSARFDSVRERIRQGRSRILQHGPDYLAYCLLDAVVDQFFPVVDGELETLAALESEILQGAGKNVISLLSAHKHDLIALRRVVSPLHEAIGELLRSQSLLVDEETRPYLRDTLDHTRQLHDLIDAAQDLASGLLSIHLSMMGFRTGETMRLLTIIATIFIPLTFLAGVWGMNFRTERSPFNMPELDWAYGYPAALLVMLLTAAAMLFTFRRRGWIGRPRGEGSQGEAHGDGAGAHSGAPPGALPEATRRPGSPP